MTPASGPTNRQLRFFGIQAVNNDGQPTAITHATVSLIAGTGDPSEAQGVIENLDTQAGKFDLVLKPGTLPEGESAALATFNLKVGIDLDGSGDNDLVEEIAYTFHVAEASALNLGEPIEEPIA